MSNKPIESFHAGNIEVAIWENQGDDSKIFHTVTAKRTYMDGNGEWREAGTVHLLPQQIPDLILALQKGHEHLRMGMRNRRRQQPSAGDAGHSGKAQEDSLAARDTDAASQPDQQQEGAIGGTSAHEQGFAEKLGPSRGGARRSR